MSYEQEVSVHINDWGYQLEFKTETDKGDIVSLFNLSGVSGLCFTVISGLSHVMWRDCVSGHFVVDNPSGGLVSWTVPQGFFDQTGVFEGKLATRISGARRISFNDLRISITGRP